MPYVYPPAQAVVAGAGGSAETILTSDGTTTVQQKLNELDAEIELLIQDKLVLEFID